MEMIPIIMNTNFEKIGEIDYYSSFIWTTRYYTCGDFDLVLPITDETMRLIKKDYYIKWRGSEEVGVIENIKMSSDGKQRLTVRGRFVSSIIGRRIVGVQTQFNNKPIPQIIETLLTDAIISPAIAARKISNFAFVDESGVTERITVQYTAKNILDTVRQLCETYGIGFKGTINSGNIVFTLFKGVDRSCGQSERPRVIFDPDYDNLNTSDYEEDYKTLVTDVLVAGEDQGSKRKTIWATKENLTGLDRYEGYTDARDSSTNDGQISTSVYLEQLRQDGLEEITSYTTAFAGTISLDSYKYGEDVFIGDIVTVNNSDWNIGMNTRIVELIQSTGESGAYTVTPTFGA